MIKVKKVAILSSSPLLRFLVKFSVTLMKIYPKDYFLEALQNEAKINLHSFIQTLYIVPSILIAFSYICGFFVHLLNNLFNEETNFPIVFIFEIVWMVVCGFLLCSMDCWFFNNSNTSYDLAFAYDKRRFLRY